MQVFPTPYSPTTMTLIKGSLSMIIYYYLNIIIYLFIYLFMLDLFNY